MTERKYKVQKAPITPFAWACLAGLVAIVAICLTVVVWLAWEFSK